MSEPIKSKRLNDLASAPTPHNTPATVPSSFAGRVGSAQQQPSFKAIKEEGNFEALANNPALLSMIQGRLGTLVGKSSGYVESLPKAVRDRVSALKGLQGEHSKLVAKFQLELLELEKKYLDLYTPLYERRSKIVHGDNEPTVEEIEAGAALEEENRLTQIDEEEEDEEEGETSKKESAVSSDDEEEEEDSAKGVPQFWATALQNLPILNENISERDLEALAYLTDIRLKYPKTPGFTLEFVFDENNFFKNKVLTKSYYYQDDIGYGGDFIYDHAVGTEIKWTSPENNLTVTIEKRKQRNKHTKATRTIEKTIPVPSFFDFFDPPKALDEDEVDDEEELENNRMRLSADYAIGEEIKDKLIPHAVDWFTGEALDYEDEGDFDEAEDFEEYSDDDEDEDDDDNDDDTKGQSSDDDDDEDVQPKKDPAECKQS